MEEQRIAAAGAKLMRALQRIDDKRPGEIRSLSMAQLLCLFYVASRESQETRLSDVWKALELSGSTSQRSLSLLGEHTRNERSPSLGLVDIRMDPEDRRERIVRLSAKGKRLMENIASDVL